MGYSDVEKGISVFQSLADNGELIKNMFSFSTNMRICLTCTTLMNVISYTVIHGGNITWYFFKSHLILLGGCMKLRMEGLILRY